MITPPDAVPSLGVGGFFVMILIQLTFMFDLHCRIGLGLGFITSMR